MDWFKFLLQFGTTAMVVGAALFLMGKWLLARINDALKSYVTAYAQESAKIDARIQHLEKLAEEQARLTRTVESIKDEIAAQAKSRDNRWEFQKDVYLSLINDTTALIRFYMNILRLNAEERTEHIGEFRAATDALMVHLCHARLAMAVEVFDAVVKTTGDLVGSVDSASLSDDAIGLKIRTYVDLRNQLCIAGRKDLWGTPEAEAKTDEAKAG